MELVRFGAVTGVDSAGNNSFSPCNVCSGLKRGGRCSSEGTFFLAVIGQVTLWAPDGGACSTRGNVCRVKMRLCFSLLSTFERSLQAVKKQKCAAVTFTQIHTLTDPEEASGSSTDRFTQTPRFSPWSCHYCLYMRASWEAILGSAMGNKEE